MSPRFLGMTYDAGLTFREHVDRMMLKAAVGVSMMQSLAGCDWRWSRNLMGTTYFAVVRVVFSYGSIACAPWMSETVWNAVERVQLEAAHVIGLLSIVPTP